MARRKRNSATLEQVERRLESIQSIAADLDLGGGLSVQNFVAVIDNLEAKLATYNTALSNIDKMADDVRVAERAARAMAEKMLMGIGSHYGKTSQEYEMAGGSRRQHRSHAKATDPVAELVMLPVVEPSQNGASAAPITV